MIDVPSLQLSLEDVPVPLVYATHRIIRDVNTGFADLFGYEKSELIDQSFSLLYPGVADFVMTGNLWRKSFSGGRSYVDERIMRRRDGTRFWCRTRGKSMIASDPFSKAVYCFEEIQRPLGTDEKPLTPRQRQIVTLISLGKTNAEIADELGLSIRSIETHRYRLMQRHRLKNTAELVAWFSRLGSGS